MTEDDVRRIVREEIEKSKPPTHYRGIPLPPNSPVVQNPPSWLHGPSMVVPCGQTLHE